jgi:hypothetical protein
VSDAILNLRLLPTLNHTSDSKLTRPSSTAGERTGPVSGFPPELPQETTDAITQAASNDPVGQHQGGEDKGTEVQDILKEGSDKKGEEGNGG